VEREFVSLLHRSKSWPERPVRVAQVVLSCARIRVELSHAEFADEAAWIALEVQSGWLLAGVEKAGWLRHLTAEQGRALRSALAGLYRLAGVDFVREQLVEVLPLRRFQLTGDQLVVWSKEGDQASAFDLYEPEQQLRARSLTDGAPAAIAPLDARQIFFSRLPLTWARWCECWQRDQNGEGHPVVFGEGMRLWPAEIQAPAPAAVADRS
jgi:hypothetical protein